MNSFPKHVVFGLCILILAVVLISVHLPVLADDRAPAGFTDTPTPAETDPPPPDTPVPPDTTVPDTPAPPDTPVPPARTPAPKAPKERADPTDTPYPTSTRVASTPVPTLSVTPGIPITGRALSATTLLWIGLIAGILSISVVLSRRFMV
jgi:uncharacterized membrane protein